MGNDGSNSSGTFKWICLVPIVFPSLLLAAGILSFIQKQVLKHFVCSKKKIEVLCADSCATWHMLARNAGATDSAEYAFELTLISVLP